MDVCTGPASGPASVARVSRAKLSPHVIAMARAARALRALPAAFIAGVLVGAVLARQRC